MLPTCLHLREQLKKPYLFLKRFLGACLPHFCHHLTIDLSIGMAIALVILYFHNYPFLLDIEDAGMDWVMQIRQKQIPSIQEKNIPPFVVLDIDENTHKEWKEPLFTPRRHLKNLIQAAVKGEARLVIVDIDLSQKTPTEGLELPKGFERHPYDQELLDYLQSYVTSCKTPQGNSTCPLIILARNFYLDSPENLLLKPRIGFLEENLKQPEPYIQWASALFYSSHDQSVRRWSLWQPTCLRPEGGRELKTEITPSMELLAAVLIRNNSTPQESHKMLAIALEPFKPVDCANTEYDFPRVEEIVSIGELKINTDIKGIHQRIVYSMPWLENGKPPVLPHPVCSEGKCDAGNPPILTIFPAHPFAQSDFPEEALKQNFKDKVVVIGGSYRGGSDIHKTPLGEMPGYMIVINAVHSLLQYEMIKTLPSIAKLSIEALLIICMSFMLVCFHSLWGMIFAGVVVIFVLLPGSIVLFNYGVWLDFALPLVAVLIHQFHHLHNELKELEKLRCHNKSPENV